MNPKQDWHRSRIGRVVLYLGSIKFAIPILVLTAASLVYGTWIESTISARQAGAVVYGSWWFILLMILICQTLVLAVVTRYPWRKKHSGFIIVHASLITIIISGFVTFFTNVEGEMALKEGMSTNSLRLGNNELQLLTHENGEFTPIGSSVVDMPGLVRVNDIQFEIVELWENSTEEMVVQNDGLNQLHAVEINFGIGDEGHWVGQLRPGEQAPMLHGVEVRVLPQGEQWVPPTVGEAVRAVLRHSKSGMIVELDDESIALGEGWEIENLSLFEHAIVGSDGLEEGSSDRDNPAVQVMLAHVDGSRERHAAFDNFRESINKNQIQGNTFSEYVLEFTGESINHPLVVFTRDDVHTMATIRIPNEPEVSVVLSGDGPWTFDVAGEKCQVVHAYTNARGTSKLIEAAQAAENQPVARVRVVGDHADHDHDVMTLVWGQRSMIQIDDELMGISFAPSTSPVPFSVELIEFRKRDYPGSEMAMAYESDVVFIDESGNSHEQTIWMNNPLEHKGWKIYQAGFVGEDVSIFQVAKDPGLIPMYIGCVLLCTGILVMYYSKAYSYGHPGMPKVFEAKKSRRIIDAATHNNDHIVRDPDSKPSSKSGRDTTRLEVVVCSDSGSGSRAKHANGHARKTRRSRSHRANKVG
ncbi:MAG: cytochrome c biogenesis protein ResB [Phycisphaerales bacterium]|nr:cytochrome c biogenesis protein ResB [Phycisphaerales bacterium]